MLPFDDRATSAADQGHGGLARLDRQAGGGEQVLAAPRVGEVEDADAAAQGDLRQERPEPEVDRSGVDALLELGQKALEGPLGDGADLPREDGAAEAIDDRAVGGLPLLHDEGREELGL